jgi:hypothetical protein
MNFDQGELDLSGGGSDKGYQKWQLELDEKKRAFELRYGVIIGRRVQVQLIGKLEPMVGMIYLVSKKGTLSTTKIRLKMGSREFSPTEIESILRLEDGLQ